MDTQEAIKNDILQYLANVAQVTEKRILKKALQIIKDSAHQEHSLDQEMLCDKKIREYAEAIGIEAESSFFVRISWNFSPRHYNKIIGFVRRYEAILEAEWKIEEELEARIEEEIQAQVDPLGDSEYDELGCPDFAVCIHEDWIEVRAYELGIGDLLPKKNKKFIGAMGDLRWRYPLSSEQALRALNRPIVKVADLIYS